MDNASVYELGSRVELIGALCLWVAIFLRIPAARHSQQQKRLLMSVVGIAGSITVYLDPVTAAINRNLVFAQSCGMFMNAWGVLSSALILDFTLAAVSRRRPWLVYGLMAATVAVLVALDETVSPDSGCVTAQYVPWYSPFWWILIASHLIGTIPCVVLCVRYARQTKEDRSLRAGLLLLAGGFTSSTVFWTIVLGYLLARPSWLGALFPLNIGITAWLMVAGVLLPLVLTARRWAGDAFALRRLRPLWLELTAAVPHVALDAPRPILRDLMATPRSVHLRLYRQVVEIRDAMLALRDLVTPETVEQARRHVHAHGLPEAEVEPAVVACWLGAALRAQADHVPARASSLALVNPGGHGLQSEVAFLKDVARARGTAPVRAFRIPQAAAAAPPPLPTERTITETEASEKS
ncbi:MULTISPECIES: MAB_1171c family putative transporter [Streptomyces]|uniref:DUF6545 domain-containing protein n=1 Tax=Streptomyces luteosporeus TaxID=173856 RepID=A0ABN3TLV1_9ACTN